MCLRQFSICLVLISSQTFAQQPPPFKSEVNLVNITAIARAANGKLVSDLSKEDFEVFEDGIPQKINFFARETDLPLGLGLIIDVSGSQDKVLKQHNQDVATFLHTVMRPLDQAFALCFGNHLRLISDITDSPSQIIDGLANFRKSSSQFLEIGPKETRDLGTALYDAVYFSISEKLREMGHRRRALLVFSDGEENSSEHDMLDAIGEAQNADALLYCIRYTQSEHGRLTARNKYGMRVMQHMSNLTGAAEFDALAVNLEDVFSQIGNELRAMYQISYVSTSAQLHDGTFRKITVHCKNPDLSVRAKPGYYAR